MKISLAILIFVLAVSCLFVFSPVASAAEADPQVIYVSPTGKDSWSGRIREPNTAKTDGPLASIGAARAAVRKARTTGPARPTRVEIAAGIFFLREPLIFTPDDSGTKEAPITYAAAAGAQPVIHAGRVITGWKRDAATGFWTTEIPAVKEGKWRFRQLFVNGVRYDCARHPDRKDWWHQFDKTLMPEEPAALAKQGDLKPWRQGDEVEVVLMRIWDISRLRIASVDWSAGILRFQVSKAFSVLDHWKGDRRYYLENSLSFLNAPGEWFLDCKTGILYLNPLKEHNLTRAQVVAPVMDQLVRIQGGAQSPVRYLRFQGLAFQYSDWTLPPDGYDGHQGDIMAGAAFHADFSESCAFEDCSFEHLGRYAIWLNQGCRQNRIVRCEFADLGGGAVWVGENRRLSIKNLPPLDKETALNEILENHVHDCGKIWYGSYGIAVGPSSSNRIARNHVHDLPYSGIGTLVFIGSEAGRCGQNIIEENHVHDVMQSMSDGGGIYNFGVHPGNIVRNNIIHDLPGYEPVHWANGIYIDEHSRDTLVESNLVYRVGRWGLCIGMGEGNVIRNNIFAQIGGPMINSSKGKGNVIEQNIFAWTNDVFQKGTGTGAFRMDKNVYFHTDGTPVKFYDGKTFDRWRAETQDLHSVVTNPGFANLATGDFSLSSNSPAIQVGFTPFKLPVIGPPALDYGARTTAVMRRAEQKKGESGR